MSDTTISTYEFLQRFPTADAARLYLEERRWDGRPVCPHCGGTRHHARTGKRIGYYRCHDCAREFTVRTGTIFERSHVPLNKWLYTMYLLVTSRKGVSSLQLSKEIGVTQKTAWFMLGRLREACSEDAEKLSGVVEVDEAFIGGKERSKHRNKRSPGGGTNGKAPVIGMRQRGGRTIAKPVTGTDKRALQTAISQHVTAGTMIYTDEHGGYHGMEAYWHDTVRHTAGQYVRAGNIHTNSIESVWAVLKRSIHGTWHKVSVKHLGRYVDEVTFRLNEGNVKIPTMLRLDAFLARAFEARITYQEITA